ncbi:uncharacterized protein LAESUDRAFT_758584 [Laetiporus sulphureus 93-53]|uniref:Uncharacterized protein n=1 Tax=Laetiporus sulphureus 93-53 TaxID=1314785 RepID=A0A165EJ03_9APHY|nr:uncharacterized protein LAESUDRAFT_758584 [Laetiporus sulphureus 93-53]KZT07150.1 hypothetical protein LAESUDRAFT_758584 [Laetiporus sulphureus 93-53]
MTLYWDLDEWANSEQVWVGIFNIWIGFLARSTDGTIRFVDMVDHDWVLISHGFAQIVAWNVPKEDKTFQFQFEDTADYRDFLELSTQGHRRVYLIRDHIDGKIAEASRLAELLGPCVTAISSSSRVDASAMTTT